MSSYLNIAATTATFKYRVETAIAGLPFMSGPAIVKTEKPQNQDKSFSGVNIHLYQTLPNSAFRNQDLATRAWNGQLLQKPTVPLELYYLLSFYGDESIQEPQRLMGAVVASLYSQPVFSPNLINDAIVASDSGSYLKKSTLSSQAEAIIVNQMPISLEELSKIWTVFYQVTHVLSVVYQVSPILIESNDIIAKPAYVQKVHSTVNSSV